MLISGSTDRLSLVPIGSRVCATVLLEMIELLSNLSELMMLLAVCNVVLVGL